MAEIREYSSRIYEQALTVLEKARLPVERMERGDKEYFSLKDDRLTQEKFREFLQDNGLEGAFRRHDANTMLLDAIHVYSHKESFNRLFDNKYKMEKLESIIPEVRSSRMLENASIIASRSSDMIAQRLSEKLDTKVSVAPQSTGSSRLEVIFPDTQSAEKFKSAIEKMAGREKPLLAATLERGDSDNYKVSFGAVAFVPSLPSNLMKRIDSNITEIKAAIPKEMHDSNYTAKEKAVDVTVVRASLREAHEAYSKARNEPKNLDRQEIFAQKMDVARAHHREMVKHQFPHADEAQAANISNKHFMGDYKFVNKIGDTAMLREVYDKATEYRGLNARYGENAISEMHNSMQLAVQQPTPANLDAFSKAYSKARAHFAALNPEGSDAKLDEQESKVFRETYDAQFGKGASENAKIMYNALLKQARENIAVPGTQVSGDTLKLLDADKDGRIDNEAAMRDAFAQKGGQVDAQMAALAREMKLLKDAGISGVAVASLPEGRQAPKPAGKDNEQLAL